MGQALEIAPLTAAQVEALDTLYRTCAGRLTHPPPSCRDTVDGARRGRQHVCHRV